MNAAAALTQMPPVRGRLTAHAPLAPLVWFKSGGAADWLLEPADPADLCALLAARPAAMPAVALGLGGHLLGRGGGGTRAVGRRCQAIGRRARREPRA